MIEDVLENLVKQPKIEEFDFSVEERNYSKSMFKKVNKLRVDGIAFGVRIPTLSHDLMKPEKKRTVFTVFGIISTIILILGSLATLWILAGIIPPLLEGAGLISDLSSNQFLSLFSLGLTNLFGGVISAFFWLLSIAIVAIFMSLIFYLLYFVRRFFNLSTCSIQEMAEGFDTKNLVKNIIVLVVLSTLATGGLIYVFIIGIPPIPMALIITFAIVLAVMIYSIVMLVFVVKEKKKAKESFKELPVEAQENYIEHTNALARVKSRINRVRKVGDEDHWNFF